MTVSLDYFPHATKKRTSVYIFVQMDIIYMYGELLLNGGVGICSSQLFFSIHTMCTVHIMGDERVLTFQKHVSTWFDLTFLSLLSLPEKNQNFMWSIIEY